MSDIVSAIILALDRLNLDIEDQVGAVKRAKEQLYIAVARKHAGLDFDEIALDVLHKEREILDSLSESDSRLRDLLKNVKDDPELSKRINQELAES